MSCSSNRPSGNLKDFVAARLDGDLRWTRLAGDGSDKIFWRVTAGDASLIAVDGSGLSPDRWAENAAFLNIGRHLFAKGLPVPEIVDSNAKEGLFLIEDLGDALLVELANKMAPAERLPLYRRVVETLLEMQTAGVEGFDPAWCAQTARYDAAMILRYETGYFLKAFAAEVCRVSPPPEIEAELERLADRAAAARPIAFLHRDFQSRNILIHHGEVRIIDFQSGRLGPMGYDLASLLIDPYVSLTEGEREELLGCYIDLAVERKLIDPTRFRRDYQVLALHRNFQILGAFAHLSRVKGRAGFAEHIPAALAGLKALIDRPEFDRCPETRRFILGLDETRSTGEGEG